MTNARPLRMSDSELYAGPTVVDDSAHTWAARVDGQTVQAQHPSAPIRGTNKEVRNGVISRSQQQVMQLACAERRVKNQAFQKDVADFHQEIKTKAKKIGDTNSRSMLEVTNLIHATSSYTRTRKPNSFNTRQSYIKSQMTGPQWDEHFASPSFDRFKVEHKAKACEPGKRPLNTNSAYKMWIIREMAKDPSLFDMTPELEQQLTNNILMQRETQAVGARITNRSAAQDMNRTWDQIASEASKLLFRTGTNSFGFATQSHSQASGTPLYFTTGQTANFIRDYLMMEPSELAVKFHAWSIQNSRMGQHDDKKTLQGRISATMTSCLRYAAKNRSTFMVYENFEKEISILYKLKIEGWPEDSDGNLIDFKSPSDISSVKTLLEISTRLDQGRIRFRAMTSYEVEVLQKKLDGAKKTRKRRKDAGMPRPKKVKTTHVQDGSTGGGPAVLQDGSTGGGAAII
ncbi:hypothetical protein DL96DRAFT_1682681 [Flagelloscypha sp. PMI_526]|nr:hypothetical protein DL96DRAFT_1682681 [Flagelloscypha sp. PMI_526]